MGGDVSLSHLQSSAGPSAAQEGGDAAGTLTCTQPGSLQMLLDKPLLAKRWKSSSHDFHYLIVFPTLNPIEAASRELHFETDKTFASVLLIIGAAHFTLNINGLQLLFK